MRRRIVKAPALPGSPSRPAALAPGGSIGGASPHLMSAGVSATWSGALAAVAAAAFMAAGFAGAAVLASSAASAASAETRSNATALNEIFFMRPPPWLLPGPTLAAPRGRCDRRIRKHWSPSALARRFLARLPAGAPDLTWRGRRLYPA